MRGLTDFWQGSTAKKPGAVETLRAGREQGCISSGAAPEETQHSPSSASPIETVQQRIAMHDRYQVELKLDYEMVAGEQTRYQIFTYIFVPQSLDITPDTYVRRDFYRDVQSYIRLKTPTFTPYDILRSPTSPLRRIEQIVQDDHWIQRSTGAENLIIHFKFLRAILKSALRDYLNARDVKRLFRRVEHEAEPLTASVEECVNDLLDTTTSILRRYRACGSHIDRPGAPANVRQAYQLTDESISILIEERWLQLLQFCQRVNGTAALATLQQRLRQCIHDEVAHRAQYSSASVVQPDGDNEEHIYRTSILKKFTSSVLYLATDIRREGTALEQILYALSAGLAMVFATIVAFYFQRAYGMFTFPLFVALVVGYMFKDRIKAGGRQLFERYLRNKLYDRRTIIKTRDGQHRIGVLREKMRFIPEEDVPAEVLSVRDRGLFSNLANDGQGEQIIRYSKEVVLNKDVFARIYPDSPPITGINDILRYDVRPYLRKMANPTQRKMYLDGDELCTVRCQKVYHLNMVSVYRITTPTTATTSTKTRVVLNRKGIRRVEQT